MDFDKKILIESAKVIEVIQAEVYLGIGTDNDPIRKVVQYWNPCTGEYLAERLANKITKAVGTLYRVNAASRILRSKRVKLIETISVVEETNKDVPAQTIIEYWDIDNGDFIAQKDNAKKIFSY